MFPTASGFGLMAFRFYKPSTETETQEGAMSNKITKTNKRALMSRALRKTAIVVAKMIFRIALRLAITELFGIVLDGEDDGVGEKADSNPKSNRKQRT